MKKNKILIIIITILSILVISMGSYIIYDNFIEKTNNIDKNDSNQIDTTDNNNNNSDNISSNDTKQDNNNYIIKSKIIGNLSKESHELDVEITDDNGNIHFNYPKINLEGENIENLNKKIEENVNKTINEINNAETNNQIGYKITLIESKKNISLVHLNYYRYEIIENENNIIVKRYNVSLTEWATGYDYLDKQYTINKVDKSIKEETFEQPLL